MVVRYQKQWGFLKKNFESGRLAHAFLFSGQDLESIKSFTKEFIKRINCLSPNFDGREDLGIKENSCNGCQNCKMIDLGTFPDLLIVKSSESESSKENDKDMMEIDIKQIRDAGNFLSYKSYYGGVRAVAVENAERMNLQAQNCFLKTLEEPKGKKVIFLITSRPDVLLSTVLSRCQHIKFFNGSYDEISNGEQKILQEIKTIMGLSLAEKFIYAKNTNLERGDLSRILIAMQKHFRQLLLLKISNENRLSINSNIAESNYSLKKIKKNLLLIEDLIYKISTTSVNKKLALEVLLMEI